MVSKASEDLPDPDSPVMTTSLSRGISTSTFLRLCSRAPRTEMDFCMECSKLKRLAMAIATSPCKRQPLPPGEIDLLGRNLGGFAGIFVPSRRRIGYGLGCN